MVKAIYFLNRHRTRKLIPDVCSVSLDTRSFSLSILFKTKSPQLQQLFYIVWEIFPMESWKCISSCIQFEGNKTFNLFRFDMRWNRKSKSAKKSKNIFTNLWVEAKQVKNLLNYFKYQVLSRSFESILLLLFSFPKPLQNSLCIYEIARLRDRRTTNLGRTWQPGLLGGDKVNCITKSELTGEMCVLSCFIQCNMMHIKGLQTFSCDDELQDMFVFSLRFPRVNIGAEGQNRKPKGNWKEKRIGHPLLNRIFMKTLLVDSHKLNSSIMHCVV